mmetsp:Transcript_29082/g.68360  ORF Transcript_29082/g.68360 Transcript_29082/m.68360 type:complete len:224 (+) Transcript_29082:162-833(+)
MGSQPRRKDSCRSTAPTTLSKLLTPPHRPRCLQSHRERRQLCGQQAIGSFGISQTRGRRRRQQPGQRLARCVQYHRFALIPIVVLNAMNWDWAELWRLVTMTRSMNTNTNTNTKNTNTIPSTLAGAWTGEWFDLFYYWATLVYFGTDLVWVWILPSSVRSPGLICKHHCIALVLYFCRWSPVMLPGTGALVHGCHRERERERGGQHVVFVFDFDCSEEALPPP